VKFLAKASDKEPILDEVHYWLAEVHFKGKNFKDSFFYAQKLTSNYPQSKFLWWAYLLMGSNNIELGEKRTAEEILKNIVARCPDREVIESAYFNLLDLYFNENDYFQVISTGEKYIKDFPKGTLEPKAYYYLGETYYAQGKFDKAITNFELAENVTNDPYILDLVWRGLSLTYTSKDNEAEANKYMSKIVSEELRLFTEGTRSFKQRTTAMPLKNLAFL